MNRTKNFIEEEIKTYERYIESLKKELELSWEPKPGELIYVKDKRHSNWIPAEFVCMSGSRYMITTPDSKGGSAWDEAKPYDKPVGNPTPWTPEIGEFVLVKHFEDSAWKERKFKGTRYICYDSDGITQQWPYMKRKEQI